jgi:pimeloyl-ACP methyl ester carboxylesterase
MRLVLLPGMDGTGLLFCRFVAALGPNFESTVVEYPAVRALGYTELEAIASLSLPRNQPFVILGESFSGPIAISLAAARPTGLIGLVLCCSFARNPLPIFSGLGSLLGLVPFHLIPKVLISPFIFGRFSSKALRAEQATAISRVSNGVLRARMKAILTVDVTAKLQQVAVPVLYLRGSEDQLVAQAASKHICRVAPRVRVVELEGPHLLLQANPAAAAKIIRDFSRDLATTDARSSS